MFTAELISRILEQITNVKIQLWNLEFVEAYQNSILRGQGLSILKGLEEHFVFPPQRSGSRSESKAEDSVLQAEIRKAVKRSVVAVVKF